MSHNASSLCMLHCERYHRVLRWCVSSSSAISSSSWHVSVGFAIHAVVHASRALKSFAPALRNWSPTWSVFPPSIDPNILWQARTPQLLSPISTNTSLPPRYHVSTCPARQCGTQTVEGAKWQSLSDLRYVLGVSAVLVLCVEWLKTYQDFLYDQHCLLQSLSTKSVAMFWYDTHSSFFPDNLGIHSHVLHCVPQ